MTVDVDPPDPPSLRDRPADASGDVPSEGEGRRAALAEMLHEGAWADGFAAWADRTDLVVAEFSVAVEHGLIDGIDLHWDAESGTVGYAVPPLPDALRASVDHGDAEEIRAAVDELAETVAATLETEYLPREEGVFEFSAGDTGEEFRDTE